MQPSAQFADGLGFSHLLLSAGRRHWPRGDFASHRLSSLLSFPTSIFLPILCAFFSSSSSITDSKHNRIPTTCAATTPTANP
ncbi:hypothetical protein CCM_09064 [Cordyceps militaris CM01]|uniref:Uncharacterized protein n=1 Tax=Cordyceps militaris (strain CM01) TaxID=983644 RepID=G3JT20_CORMM|nr:uncharacterized protein CCM_09064 [Cordyceps militaris CM01]EGX89016.1 hypothetical protein CCM_09064 [Cordyceps militaris CM01]